MSPRIPTYRYHKARDCAVVTLRGRDHYLGAYDSPASREAYHRLVAEYLAEKARPTSPCPTDPQPLTVVELLAQYLRFANDYYRKDGRPTGELFPLKRALAVLRRLYGRSPAADFTPAKLKAVREAMLAEPVTRRVKVVDPATGKVLRYESKVIQVGWSRRVVNKQVGRIKRVFGWAVAQELVPPAVAAALAHVGGLKRGRTAAREKARVVPVDTAVVDRTVSHLPPAVRAMVAVQRLTGCRPQEVVLMRAEEVDAAGDVWEYRPGRYKTAHHRVGFTPAGEAAWAAWYDALADELADPALPAVLVGPWVKMRSHAARLALILHLLWTGGELGDGVGADAVGRAVRLVGYFQAHARRVYARLRQAPENGRLHAVLDWVRKRGGRCTPREVTRAGLVTDTAEARKVLRELADRGYGRMEAETAANGQKVERFVFDPA